jgi:RNA polymerase sigma-70 factor (ECF subfamily)
LNDATDIVLDLLEREGRSLHALLFRLTLRREVAEDLMQDLFLKLARSKGKGQVQNLPAYARRAAINLAFDWRRSCRHHSATDAAQDAVADDSPLPLAAIMERERWQAILEAAATLSGVSREIFVRHYLEGETYALIAGALGKTPHQVRALCHRAMLEVRDHLGVGLQRAPAGKKEGSDDTGK